jgi:hypothetical protein
MWTHSPSKPNDPNFHNDEFNHVKLIAGQWSEEVCEFFEVCIGRLFYPVGMKDNYQFMPMLKGDGNTGKSTIISAIGTMMPASSIDVISANLEKTFGLQGMNKKRNKPRRETHIT